MGCVCKGKLAAVSATRISGNNSLGANIRLRWEYQPGSELFVVFNEQRDTLVPRYPELQNRSFVIKINRLLRF